MAASTLSSRLARLPASAEKPVKLRVSASAESKLRAGYPWLLAERVQAESHRGRAGDLAVVFDRRRRFVAVGLYDPQSPVRMRVLRARQPGPIDRSFFAQRIGAALERRRGLTRTGTDGYRMVHGESDEMPGLVVDRYAETGVVKLYSAAWVPHLRSCVEALLDQSPLEHLVLRLSRRVARQPEALCGLEDGDLLAGDAPGERVIFRENGLRFEVDPVRGQKTGFFLDQRDNRARVESLTPKGRVLNAFAYTGGFSVYAARGGAHEVWSLDQSRLALEAARRNFELNRNLASVAASTHETLEGDAFESMAELARSGAQFELVVVDPPAFATRRAQVRGALEAYGRLAHLGVTLTAPDGVIVLASCSRPVSAEQFRGAVCSASARAGRPLRILEETTHALDHPTDFAESRYLKCVYARPHARGRR